MGDDVVRFFTTKFMVHQQLTEGFPPSEKSLTLFSLKANNIRKLSPVRKVLDTYQTWLSWPALPINPCRVLETLCSELPSNTLDSMLRRAKQAEDQLHEEQGLNRLYFNHGKPDHITKNCRKKCYKA
ncbi:hypothetical protein CIRG_05019 [Coccidioides immitis RMSCC 2394]|uniref:Uncharacterized protein n=1 Tax=Coccidioides immitis RMSCC 2394 TaxID=404692 RepID=A0A0J6YEC9_COCIT|nr:hypothetical protein CIRG_05019 [Coccidioides immitis RMSCC 2394]